MSKQRPGFDYHRYRQLLAEAIDEPKRLALIDTLIEENAREKLAAQRSHDIMQKITAASDDTDGKPH